jgi:Flp pilus assembly protein TadD
MSFNRREWMGLLVSLGGCVLAAGCHAPGRQVAHAPPPVEHSTRLTVKQQADVQIAFARSLEKSGTAEQATAAYEDALKKDPRRADAHDRLAVLNARKGQFDAAVTLHKKALGLQPDNADFVCNLGYCYYLQQRWAEAETQFRRAIELAPTHSRALNNLGLVLARTDRSKEALAAFRRGGCSEADAHSNLAFALTLDSSWKEAQQHFVRAQELDPASSPAQKGLRAVSAQLNPTHPVTPQPPTGPRPVPAVVPAQTFETPPVAPSEPITRVPSYPEPQFLEFAQGPAVPVDCLQIQPSTIISESAPTSASSKVENAPNPKPASKLQDATPLLLPTSIEPEIALPPLAAPAMSQNFPVPSLYALRPWLECENWRDGAETPPTATGVFWHHYSLVLN